MHPVVKNLQTVFSDWRCATLSIVVACLFYAFNALLFNFRLVWSSFTTQGFAALQLDWRLIAGYHTTIAWYSLTTLLIISVLFGIFFSLILFKTICYSEKKHPGLLGSLGIFLGVLAPGCAACGLGIFSVLGISAAAITFLPYDGLEISFLAIAILVYAVFVFARDLTLCKR